MMEKNDRYFIMSLISLAASLFLLPLALYLLPNAWFGWSYHLPDFILSSNDWLQDNFSLNDQAASWVVFGVILVLSLLFAGLAYFAATRPNADMKHILTSTSEDDAAVKPVKQDRRQLVFLIIKVAAIMILAYFIAQMMQWAIAVSPT